MFEQEKGLILAADVELEDLRKLCKIIAGDYLDEFVAIKVGFKLALTHGLQVVTAIVKGACGLPVIYDHQKAGTDIPAMGQVFADVCKEAGVVGVIVFPLSGPKTLEGFVTSIQDCGMYPIVGLAMTHEQYLSSEGGYIEDNSLDRIRANAVNLGAQSFVLPSTKTVILASHCRKIGKADSSMEVLMPGIGSQGGSITQSFGIVKYNKCRPFGIIGSAIYKAEDPRKAIDGFVQEFRKV